MTRALVVLLLSGLALLLGVVGLAVIAAVTQ
jgi:hypothetical protein